MWISPTETATVQSEKPEATLVLAVNGPAEESELDAWKRQDLPDRIGATNIRWVNVDETISLAGKTYIKHDFWKVLMVLTLGCLLVEMAMLVGWRRLRSRPRRDTATASAAGRSAS